MSDATCQRANQDEGTKLNLNISTGMNGTQDKPQVLAKFPDEVLEHIAETLTQSRSGSEITRFFRSAGYPEFIHDGSTKKWFVLGSNKGGGSLFSSQEIIDDLESALEQFRLIANDLGSEPPEKVVWMKKRYRESFPTL